MFLSGYHGNKISPGYQIIFENGVYMWAGTFNVTINEHLCKYNVTESVTLTKETPHLHNTIIIPI